MPPSPSPAQSTSEGVLPAPPEGRSAEPRDPAIHRWVHQMEQAVDEVEAVLKNGADLLPAAGTDAQRRELARQIVIGALLNRDNPDWDPADPATHRPIPDDPLLVLLDGWRADIEAAGALHP
jgi:hypothetical protein